MCARSLLSHRPMRVGEEPCRGGGSSSTGSDDDKLSKDDNDLATHRDINTKFPRQEDFVFATTTKAYNENSVH